MIDLGEQVFINQMQTALLWSRTDFLAPFNEASVRFLTFGLQSLTESVVVFICMQSQEMSGREVLSASRTAVGMFPYVVNFKPFNIREAQRFSVGRSEHWMALGSGASAMAMALTLVGRGDSDSSILEYLYSCS